MNAWMIAAAALSLFTAGVHFFAGGREAARPLLVSRELPAVPKFTAYYCWHMVTIVLLVMAGAFAYSAISAVKDAAALATLLAMAFAAWSLAMTGWKRLNPMYFPQWALFIPIAGTGIMALS
jgi:hypothetical protein